MSESVSSQQCAGSRFLLIIQPSCRLFPVGVVELVKESGFDHLILPWDRHSARRELLEEFVILVIKHDALDLGELSNIASVLGVHNVGLGHPRRLGQTGLQTGEVDVLEEFMLSGVLTVVPEER